MLLKSIFATLIAAGATGGAVYLSQNPDVLTASESHISSEQASEQASVQSAHVAAENLPVPDGIEHLDPESIDKISPEAFEVSQAPEIYRETEAQDEPETIRESKVTISEKMKEAHLDLGHLQDMPTQDLPELPAQPKPLDALDGAIDPVDTISVTSTSNEPRFVEQILVESAKISNVDLRDQAYLDLVDYAILRDEFKDAVLALSEISQPALRDTARNRMAIKYALNGNQSAAFDLIDELENPELSDFVRLQVVQALTVPDRLPEGVVPR